MSTVGAEAISRPTRTFCTFAAGELAHGLVTSGVLTSSFSTMSSASFRGGLRSVKKDFPFA
jgi:hypothetical protein